jgi:hypothetical protein
VSQVIQFFSAAVVAIFTIQPVMVLVHEAGHARVAERVTNRSVALYVRSGSRRCSNRLILRLLRLRRTDIWIGWKGRGGLTTHEGPDDSDSWKTLLNAGCAATLWGAFAGGLLLVVACLIDAPTAVDGALTVWLAACLADQCNRFPWPGPGKSFGSDGWHRREMKRCPGYLPPVPLSRR